MKEQSTLPTIGFIRLPKVLEVIPISRSQWLKGVKEGIYPQPVKLGPRITAWRVEDIRKLITEKCPDTEAHNPVAPAIDKGTSKKSKSKEEKNPYRRGITYANRRGDFDL